MSRAFEISPHKRATQKHEQWSMVLKLRGSVYRGKRLILALMSMLLVALFPQIFCAWLSTLGALGRDLLSKSDQRLAISQAAPRLVTLSSWLDNRNSQDLIFARANGSDAFLSVIHWESKRRLVSSSKRSISKDSPSLAFPFLFQRKSKPV